MTASTAAPTVTTIPASAPVATVGAALSDSRVMVGRELRRVVRSVDGLITAMVMPIMILTMFVFVFGGAIDTGGQYINYVVPGILLLCAGFGSASTAVSVAQDRQGGTIDRFRTMPIYGSSVLVGHVLASVVRNLAATLLVLGFAVLYGYRPGASIVQWAGALGLLVVFVLAITWLSCAVGLVLDPDATNGVTFVMLFLPYISSGFVPTDTMPIALHAFAEHQPLTPIIETMRGLLSGTGPGDHALPALLWCVGLLVVGYALASRLHKRTA